MPGVFTYASKRNKSTHLRDILCVFVNINTLFFVNLEDLKKNHSMNHWLIKSEPSKYSWEQLQKDKKTDWTGVRNYAARNNLLFIFWWLSR